MSERLPSRRWTPRVVVLLGALLAAACGRGEPPPAPGGFAPGPILLVGLDGFEWNAALPLLRRGQLPHLAALLRRGSYGTLATIPGAVSPALWTTIATGKSIEKHGVREFLKQRRPPVFFTSADRRTKAFWNILSDHERRVAVVGWFVSYPAEPVRGVMVAQANTRDTQRAQRSWKGAVFKGLPGQVHPPEREPEILALMDAVEAELPGIVAERLRAPLHSVPRRHRAMIEASQWAFRADAIYERAARLLAADRPDLLAVYFGSSDVVGHRFWFYVRPAGFPGRTLAGSLGRRLAPRLEHGSLLNRLLGGIYWSALEPHAGDAWAQQVILRTYEHLDGVLGRLTAAMPAGTTVMVVSDHGFRPWGHEDGPDAFFAAAGPHIKKMAGPAPEKLSRRDLRRLGSILDVTPTLLALQGLAPGRDMDGRPLESVLLPRPGLTRPAAVATHDTPEWLASRSLAAAEGSGEDEAERLEQLRALGYVK